MPVWLPITDWGIATCLHRAIDPTGLSPARLGPFRPLHACHGSARSAYRLRVDPLPLLSGARYLAPHAPCALVPSRLAYDLRITSIVRGDQREKPALPNQAQCIGAVPGLNHCAICRLACDHGLDHNQIVMHL